MKPRPPSAFVKLDGRAVAIRDVPDDRFAELAARGWRPNPGDCTDAQLTIIQQHDPRFGVSQERAAELDRIRMEERAKAHFQRIFEERVQATVRTREFEAPLEAVARFMVDSPRLFDSVEVTLENGEVNTYQTTALMLLWVEAKMKSLQLLGIAEIRTVRRSSGVNPDEEQEFENMKAELGMKPYSAPAL